jgi:hypothetical protein
MTTQYRCEIENESILINGREGEAGPLYTRLLSTRLDGPNHGALFLTAEVYRDVGTRGPVFPIWKSVDDGRTWVRIASVADDKFGFGNRYQPALFELPAALGRFGAGTLVLAGNAIPADLSQTNLVVYTSADGGHSWTFTSIVDSGGPAIYDPGPAALTSAVWEPNVFLSNSELVCVYADERLKSRGALQVLAHRTTSDLVHWSDQVVDYAVTDRFTRPGMFVGTGELPDGSHAGVFEVVGPPGVPVHFDRSADGMNWGSPESLGTLLRSQTGTTLSGSPHIAWHVGPAAETELLVTGRIAIEADGTVTNSGLYSASGCAGPWMSILLPSQPPRNLEGENSGYSQSVVWASDGALIQATTVRNELGSHDIVVARAALTLTN